MITKEMIYNKIKENEMKMLSFLSPMEATGAYKDLIKETQYPMNFIISTSTRGYVLSENKDDIRIPQIVEAVFRTMAVFLSDRKKTKENEAQAVILMDAAGNFKFAAWVEYFAGTKEDEPGNFNFSMSFYEDDIKALEKKKTVEKYLMNSTEYTALFSKVARHVSLEYTMAETIYATCNMCIDNIVLTLEAEARPDEVVEVSREGLFTASVAIEDNEKVFSIVPQGQLKSIIKDDIKIEI